MTTSLNIAQHHAERIEHFHANAGTAGYAQALHHLQQLEKILTNATRSARGKSEVPVIQDILKSVRPKMDEMKRRERGDGDDKTA